MVVVLQKRSYCIMQCLTVFTLKTLPSQPANLHLLQPDSHWYNMALFEVKQYFNFVTPIAFHKDYVMLYIQHSAHANFSSKTKAKTETNKMLVNLLEATLLPIFFLMKLHQNNDT